ncbi:MAG: hypothetical protein CML16_02225 [Pusillimonas sp.]|mgnify:FL=1|nr:hypothetical protein [Pusillimonas sp.]HCP77353.1 hypothetical protein [Pusillimonas sp.]|tara:strand:- start:597 stop:857 length:261 start_codon:yes stop_codon:yes gene_type:complete
MTWLSLFEWLGALLGLAGAALLAANHRLSGWGFLAFLLSNACWIAYALMTSAYGLIAMQAGYTLISAIGLCRWLLLPPLPSSNRKK